MLIRRRCDSLLIGNGRCGNATGDDSKSPGYRGDAYNGLWAFEEKCCNGAENSTYDDRKSRIGGLEGLGISTASNTSFQAKLTFASLSGAKSWMYLLALDAILVPAVSMFFPNPSMKR